MENSKPTQPHSDPKIVVLRWGHRPQRDVRLTTHVALTARALCASGFILADVQDSSIEKTVKRITARWGGDFQFEMGTPWKKAVRDWKDEGGIVVPGKDGRTMIVKTFEEAQKIRREFPFKISWWKRRSDMLQSGFYWVRRYAGIEPKSIMQNWVYQRKLKRALKEAATR